MSSPPSHSHAPIPLNDLRLQHESICAELNEAVAEVVSSCAFVGGRAVEAFAEAFSAFCGAKHTVPCATGTEALRAAILGVLGEGDGAREIVTVSHTFAATVEAIIAAGYKPVFVDVDPGTHLIDLDQAARACTPRTAAIVPVHLYGQMVDMIELRALADGRGLAVIEDAAQAHGARFDGANVGRFSDAASFSFYPGKNLGAWGDAGAVICNDDSLARRMARWIDHGRSDKYTHTHVGWNARMDALQAAVLRVKVRYLAKWNTARRRAAGWYDTLLTERADCVLPVVKPRAEHVYHQYVIQVDDRDAVRAALQAEGITTGIHYPIPVHEQPAYLYLGFSPESLPVTHSLCGRILSLPMYAEITQAQVEHVADTVARATRRAPASVG